MTAILDDFYTRVYADPQLMTFFSGFTQQRLVEKQYSFLHQAMTGNKVYFGNRPRNTHHWMVISDALMDHREQIMLECMQAHGLEDKWIKRWLAIEAYYRPDIVKTEAFPRQLNGVDLPLEGFEELLIDVGCVCDGCTSVIEPGETVRYHVRMGTIFCTRCNAPYCK
jgi:Bacterial-like globin